jgi:hypothetical protein
MTHLNASHISAFMVSMIGENLPLLQQFEVFSGHLSNTSEVCLPLYNHGWSITDEKGAESAGRSELVQTYCYCCDFTALLFDSKNPTKFVKKNQRRKFSAFYTGPSEMFR